MNKEEARASVMGAISIALKGPILQQGFELICKNLTELEKENAELKKKVENLQKYLDTRNCYRECAETWKKNKELQEENAELKAQIEKLIDFVLSKTECCDVCPITDTCLNEDGTCPYAGMLAKGEEEVTREWLMELISRR